MPGSRIEKATGRSFDDLNAIADIPVLSEILVDRQLRQRKWNDHALNWRHAEERDRLTGAERLHDYAHEIGRLFFTLGNAVAQHTQMSGDCIFDEGEITGR